MNACLRNEIRRCRPLLGTFVEVAVKHDESDQAHTAINAAFVAVERVHNLMSFHDPQSEISRLNSLATHRKISVSFETYHVLKCAKELYERTQGIFDITVASELVDNDLLPKHTFFKKEKDYYGRTNDIELLPENFVRFLRPLKIDLGGIAKGFAVDQAIDALQVNGIADGFVNAGGDIRSFGEEEYPICVRHPKTPEKLLPLVSLKNSAFATSANSYQHRLGRIGCVHIDGRTRKFLPRPFSVSVRAQSCLMADALTKVVFALGEESASLLTEFDACAFIVWPDNKIMYFEGSGWNEK